MRYSERKADVTSFHNHVVICHCISVDCAMGAGVVVPIKQKHPGVKPACIAYVKEMTPQKALGTAFRYNDENGTCYNMFSKMNVRENAKTLGKDVYLKNLENCLWDMRDQMVFRGEKYLAMPKIGSGLDRCNWEDVKALVQKVFADTDIQILVCLWD